MSHPAPALERPGMDGVEKMSKRKMSTKHAPSSRDNTFEKFICVRHTATEQAKRFEGSLVNRGRGGTTAIGKDDDVVALIGSFAGRALHGNICGDASQNQSCD